MFNEKVTGAFEQNNARFYSNEWQAVKKGKRTSVNVFVFKNVYI